ncbi:MAG: hypothetical protein HC867_08715 [Bacteroidia bacterium]|nr:hypothetical protein [Bacteroidia bacterium]
MSNSEMSAGTDAEQSNDVEVSKSSRTIAKPHVVRSPEYYTPHISEIYFGFEFEVLNSREHYFFEAADGWHRAAMDFGILGDIKNLICLIRDKQIRVKRLDEADIKSIGGELSHEEDGNPNKMYYFGKHSLIFNGVNGWCIITVRSDARQEDHTAYVGVIKNKSELKRLFDNLGVSNG